MTFTFNYIRIKDNAKTKTYSMTASNISELIVKANTLLESKVNLSTEYRINRASIKQAHN